VKVGQVARPSGLKLCRGTLFDGDVSVVFDGGFPGEDLILDIRP
jgi:hypothetical protein